MLNSSDPQKRMRSGAWGFVVRNRRAAPCKRPLRLYKQRDPDPRRSHIVVKAAASNVKRVSGGSGNSAIASHVMSPSSTPQAHQLAIRCSGLLLRTPCEQRLAV